jgi:flagellar hook-associated protein 1 FlgK
MQIDSSSNTKTGSYSIDVNGFNIVDGNTFHPIHISKEGNPSGFYEISYERQDGVLIPMEEEINGGKIGAILDLRGGQLDTTSGMPVDGIIQNSITEFDAFAKTLIESTNNLYAASATTKMSSNIIDTNPTNALLSSSLNIKEGAFDVVVYDIDGNITARRTINIDVATTMTGVVNSNSIEGQMKATVDDNGDSNANNDVDDFVKFNWATFASGDNAVEFTLDPMAQSQGYTFAIEDKLQDASFDSGSNFAGALGMSKFFSGDSASNIELKSEFSRNPTLISAGSGPVKGDNIVALNMLQHQYEKFDFQVGNSAYNNTTYGMFDMIVTEVGTQTNSAISKNETISTQFNAAEMEYFSVSKVSIDEEMTNLIKYQTSYGAAAKVITTIDAMMQTLLGIKQ